jgi:hypothetical protein
MPSTEKFGTKVQYLQNTAHIFLFYTIRYRDSAVGIATGYGLGDRGFGVRVPVASGIFSSLHHPDRLWGPPSLLSYGYRGSLLTGVKQQGREAEHLPPASTKVKKMWINTFTLPYAFMASCLVS